MFRSNQLGTPNGIPARGNADQYTNGGGPAYINNVFQGTGSAEAEARDTAGTFTSANATENATFTGEGRVGHIDALQRVSRAADTTPLHVRNDGPGLDSMDVPAFRTFPGSGGVDVPAGSKQFKLQFLVFVPTADFFASMRTSQAAQDLQHEFLDNDDDDQGLERFITATRRQNFLAPRAGTGPSRSWNSPTLTPGRGRLPAAPALRRLRQRQHPRRAPARPRPGQVTAATGEEVMAERAAVATATETVAEAVAVAAAAGSVQARRLAW